MQKYSKLGALKIITFFKQEHKPPLNLVFKKGGWTIGIENETKLINKDGEDVAVRKSHEERREVSAKRSYRARGADDSNKSCAMM